MDDHLLQKRFTEQTLHTVAEIEELAEEILTDRAQIIDCDKKRNSNREALRALNKTPSGGKEWVCYGNLFMKIPNKQAVDLIENDQNKLEKEITTLHDGLKPKVKKLHELEGLPDVSGYDLKAAGSSKIR